MIDREREREIHFSDSIDSWTIFWMFELDAFSMRFDSIRYLQRCLFVCVNHWNELRIFQWNFSIQSAGSFQERANFSNGLLYDFLFLFCFHLRRKFCCCCCFPFLYFVCSFWDFNCRRKVFSFVLSVTSTYINSKTNGCIKASVWEKNNNKLGNIVKIVPKLNKM